MHKDNLQDQINELKEQNQLLWRQISAGKKRRRYIVLALAVAIPLAVFAASIPNTFVDGEVISAEKMNANFQQALSADCPSGFTKITAQNETLGCIQNSENGNTNCVAAMLACFDQYGGRLPSFNEAHAAFQRFSTSLQNLGDNEWVDGTFYDDGTASYNCNMIHDTNGTGSHASLALSGRPYRCFIPR